VKIGIRSSASYFFPSHKPVVCFGYSTMGAGHAMKRIPRIKFPQRHPKPSGIRFFFSLLFNVQFVFIQII